MMIVYYVTLLIATCMMHKSKSEQLVSYDEAITKCASKGGLAQATWFPGVPHTVSYPDVARTDVKTYGDFNNLQLNEGESAWVGGYARYGRTLALFGCYMIFKYIRETIMLESKNSLYECSEKCAYEQQTYIGVQHQRCWCIKKKEFGNTWVRTYCDDEKTVGVYLTLNNKLYPKAQCMTEKMSNSKKTPKSREEKCTNKHSSVCTFESSTSKKKEQCKMVYNIKSFCLMEKNVMWSTSYDTCIRMEEILIPDVYAVSDYNDWFWIGQFRPFIIINKTTEMPESACLMVTRIGPDLLLEPDDCSIRLPVLCTNNLVSNKEDTPVIPSTVQNKNTIACLVSVVCVFAIIAIGFIAHKRRTQIIKGRATGNGPPEAETFLTNNASGFHISSNKDPDYSDPIDIYHTIDDALLERQDSAITQRKELDVDNTAQRNMDSGRDETIYRLPVDAIGTPKDYTHSSVYMYDVASNYPQDKSRDTKGPKNVYSHCVIFKNGSSNDYDVASNY